MRWTPGGRSKNLEDLRGQTGGGGMMIGGRGMGIGGAVIALILSLVFGVNIFDSGGNAPVPQQTAPGDVQQPVSSTPEEEKRIQFVSFVLDDVQQTWAQLLPKVDGQQYRDAKLDVFRDAVNTGCGQAPAAVGPFYCPVDQKVYVDLSFFDELDKRFGAPGDFAEAYVIAHEFGHHVQHLLGVDARNRQESIQIELQADCYAGVWGNHAQDEQLLEPGDLEEGLTAAAAVGDDRIQKQTQGRVDPESWTHGSSEQRTAAFKRGFESGDPSACR